ncbi:unnamed protein product [Didymodactylos carnosus]|uniref:Uncharacterized protein n=1 Tax=Didymodactylos carnosus TaxID=1234261 RepID=A0A813QGQ8_9BILA|nr:unnamed protein product [Didymodactylos carnosus]CAF0766813.1 unnamed protein product [Didymodactylos carnosus]CAF3504846.1 unnamed protein product [Didymodactylos carnosus]CAF3548381.1 unnamed protein product [Didymodactylos carnosus]
MARSRRGSIVNFSLQQRSLSISDPSLDVSISSDVTQQQQRKLSTIDNNSTKVLVFNAKCSDLFKQTLEDVVKDCILEFPGENSVYVSKTGHSIQIPKSASGSLPPYSLYVGENTNDSLIKQKKSNIERRRSSINLLRASIPNSLNSMNEITRASNDETNVIASLPLSLQGAAITTLSTTRMKNSARFNAKILEANIREESESAIIENNELTKESSTIVMPETVPLDRQSVRTSLTTRLNSPRLLTREMSSRTLSYFERNKDYLLSDLVLFGPEYFSHVFNLTRSSRYAPVPHKTVPDKITNTNQPLSKRVSTSKSMPKLKVQRVKQKKSENVTELDRIKQDLYHRYLWTLKPNVSCRIRPPSSYSRNATFVI